MFDTLAQLMHEIYVLCNQDEVGNRADGPPWAHSLTHTLSLSYLLYSLFVP